MHSNKICFNLFNDCYFYMVIYIYKWLKSCFKSVINESSVGNPGVVLYTLMISYIHMNHYITTVLKRSVSRFLSKDGTSEFSRCFGSKFQGLSVFIVKLFHISKHKITCI